jgi:hypothetical protein
VADLPDITDPAERREERIDAQTLRVTRRSTFTGVVHTTDLPVTAEEWDRFASGRYLIQHALPRLTDPQREFLMTGTTHEEWVVAFDLDPDEEDIDLPEKAGAGQAPGPDLPNSYPPVSEAGGGEHAASKSDAGAIPSGTGA